MPMSLYEATIPQYKKMLTNLDNWIEKAVAHAKTKAFDPNEFATARRATDAYPPTRPPQPGSDPEQRAAGRLPGKEPPHPPDTAQTIDELRARIASVVAYLETFSPADFNGAEKRMVKLGF